MSENFFKSHPLNSFNAATNSASLHSGLETAQLSKQVFAMTPDKSLQASYGMVADKAGLALNAAKEAISPMLQIIMRLPGHIGFINSMFEAIGAFFMPSLDLDFLHQLNIFHDGSHTNASTIDSHATELPNETGLNHASLDLNSNGHEAISLSLIPKDAPVFSQLKLQLNSSYHSNIPMAGQQHYMYLAGHDNPSKAMFEMAGDGPQLGGTQEVGPNQSFELMTSKPMFTEHSISASGSKIGFLDKNSQASNLSSNNSSSTTSNATALSRQQLTSQNNGSSSTNSVSSSNWVGYELKLGGNHNAITSSNYGPSGKILPELGSNNLLADANATSNDGFKPWSDSSSSPTSTSATPSQQLKELSAKELSLNVKSLNSHSLLNKSVNSPSSVHNSIKANSESTSVKPADTKSIDSKPTNSSANDSKASDSAQMTAHTPKTSQPTGKQVSTPNNHIKPIVTKNAALNHLAQGHKVQQPEITKSHPAKANVVDQNRHQTINKAYSTNAPETSNVNSQPSDTNTTDNSSASEINQGDSNLTSSYEIKAGDNLWNIAKSHLGNGLNWHKIYEMNQNILGSNPSLIRPGTVINLPTDATNAAANDISQAIDYTVQPGDNLWDIAKSHLGNGTNWSSIYNENQSIIGNNPSLIFPGQHITLHTHFMDQNSISMTNGGVNQTLAPSQSIAPSNVTDPNSQMIPSNQVMPNSQAMPSSQSLPASINPNNSASIDSTHLINQRPNVSAAIPSQVGNGYGAAYAASINNKAIVSPSLATDFGFEQ